ncbi:alkaline phosphatase family protein [Zhihengliuella halotolerans]|uniref:Type I phosphodiesterase/nucleotide pyrophosphatase n=1 Tax=Zhihengliuella halotolerans TaxID=370736 RepID=A0A4V6MGE7_9MICC|nr:nucleotide pyrophosphatase/phosphodiesterase family protein [Zhihengliuella halotolerans]RZU61146.1 type I phosphodiesterase/nucleotide pyrophosphatase [Zhihengliuella halotolerans]
MSSSELPAVPRYDGAHLRHVLPSSAAVLGVPGYENTLGLPAARRVCVVMVDGLGLSLLKARGGHAPFLRRALESNRTLDVSFPTTTAASLASFATGATPAEHGIVGYDVVDPGTGHVVNQLGNWPGWLDPVQWQPHPTVLERAAEVVGVTTVSLPEFASSQLTRAALRGGDFVGARSVQARVRAASESLAKHERSLVYLYFNELDKTGHRHGAGSLKWGEQLEELDFALRTLTKRLPASTLVLLTADHGMVDVPVKQRIDYSLHADLVAGVELTAGEPRAVQLHVADPARADRVADAWRAHFGAKVWVLTRDEAVAGGYFGSELRDGVAARIGDVLVLAREHELALYDGRRVAPHAFDMVGQHGSLTRAEREVPLLTLATPRG